MHFVIKYPFALSDTVESVQDAEIAANTGLLHKPLGSLSSHGNRFIRVLDILLFSIPLPCFVLSRIFIYYILLINTTRTLTLLTHSLNLSHPPLPEWVWVGQHSTLPASPPYISSLVAEQRCMRDEGLTKWLSLPPPSGRPIEGRTYDSDYLSSPRNLSPTWRSLTDKSSLVTQAYQSSDDPSSRKHSPPGIPIPLPPQSTISSERNHQGRVQTTAKMIRGEMSGRVRNVHSQQSPTVTTSPSVTISHREMSPTTGTYCTRPWWCAECFSVSLCQGRNRYTGEKGGDAPFSEVSAFRLLKAAGSKLENPVSRHGKPFTFVILMSARLCKSWPEVWYESRDDSR